MNWKIFLNLLIFFCFLTPAYSDLSTTEHGFPEPDPPFIERGMQEEEGPVPFSKHAPSQEWVYHKTSDNQHPDGNEQQMMWLMNRARSDPQAEGIWLSDTGDSDVDSAMNQFGVDIIVLQSEFTSYDPSPPAAFDRRLYYAAKSHSDYLISIDDQNHDGQIDRIIDEGFDFTFCGGNVFSSSETPLYGHAAFNIDWGGSSDDGMQDPRGHRINLMSVDRNFSNVGKAVVVVQESDGGTNVGPLVITENYCEALAFFQDHYNNFIVGTVWTDSNENSQYDPGEGESGVTVTPDSGTYYAVTADSGGYAIPVTSQSISTVTFSGTSLGTNINKPVSVGTESVLLNVETGSESTVTYPAELDITANNSDGPVTISAGNPLTVAISLAAGSDTGTPADWYLVVQTPTGEWQSFNLSKMDYSTSGLSALLQGVGLVSFSPAGIFSTSSLSAGTYTYYFAVVLSDGQFFYDIVTVNVQ